MAHFKAVGSRQPYRFVGLSCKTSLRNKDIRGSQNTWPQAIRNPEPKPEMLDPRLNPKAFNDRALTVKSSKASHLRTQGFESMQFQARASGSRKTHTVLPLSTLNPLSTMGLEGFRVDGFPNTAASTGTCDQYRAYRQRMFSTTPPLSCSHSHKPNYCTAHPEA